MTNQCWQPNPPHVTAADASGASLYVPGPVFNKRPDAARRRMLDSSVLRLRLPPKPAMISPTVCGVPGVQVQEMVNDKRRRRRTRISGLRGKPGKPAASPEPDPVGSDDTDQRKLAAMEADRLRKREERARDKQAALERVHAVDQQLRERLLEACHGNYEPALLTADVSPIKVAMQLGVSIDLVVYAVRAETDPRLSWPDPPARRSWNDQKLLRRICDQHFKRVLFPSMLAAMEAAGKAPQKPADASEPFAAVPEPPATEIAPVPSSEQPDAIATDELGPTLQAAIEELQPEASNRAIAKTLGVSDDTVRRDTSTNVEPPSKKTNEANGPKGNESTNVEPPAPAPSPPPPSISGAANPAPAAAVPSVEAMPAAEDTPTIAGRAAVLAAFGRARVPQQPAPQSRQGEGRAPWFSSQPAEPEPISDAALDEYLSGWKVGNLTWPRKLLGPAPGEEGCRISPAILKRNGLA